MKKIYPELPTRTYITQTRDYYDYEAHSVRIFLSPSVVCRTLYLTLFVLISLFLAILLISHSLFLLYTPFGRYFIFGWIREVKAMKQQVEVPSP